MIDSIDLLRQKVYFYKTVYVYESDRKISTEVSLIIVL